MTEQQFLEVTKWQRETFPNATAKSKVEHLKEEVNELSHDLAYLNPDRRLEFADCFLLLFGAAHADGMSFSDICKAIEDKMRVNKSRKWGRPDENGVVKHIPEF